MSVKCNLDSGLCILLRDTEEMGKAQGSGASSQYAPLALADTISGKNTLGTRGLAHAMNALNLLAADGIPSLRGLALSNSALGFAENESFTSTCISAS